MPKLDIAARAQIATLKDSTTLTNDQIGQIAGCDPRQVQRIFARAKERGWQRGTKLKDEFLEDAPRPGRTSRITIQIEEQVLAYARQSDATGQFSCQHIANALGGVVGKETARKILRKNGFMGRAKSVPNAAVNSHLIVEPVFREVQ